MRSPRFPWVVLLVAAWPLLSAACGDKYTSAGNNTNGNQTDLPLGAACAGDTECASGNCPGADGVCCDTACDAECLACVETKTGLADGTCGPVTASTDPDGECDDEGADTCGANGDGCNGDGAAPGCILYDDTTVCADVSCAAGVVTEARLCDGAGTCQSGATTDCAPFGCDAAGTGCLTTCASSGDCDTASYCDSMGTCVPKQGDGAACGDAEECASGFCVDDLCCDRLCDATCEACAAALTGGADGACGPVTADTDPDVECAAEGPATCGADGTGCNGDAANPGCNLYDTSTLCSPEACAGGLLTTLGWCDGAGSCSAGTPVLCAPYLCDPSGTACSTSCTSHANCDSSAYCDGTGSCVPKLADGSNCAISVQCQSGFCPVADGVCCGTACDATCEACVASKTGGTDGVCSAVTANQDPDMECSAAPVSSCGANGTGCNGDTAAPDCNLYDNTVQCATAGCTNGTLGGDGFCDSAGNCVQSGATSCAPYQCNAAGTACLASCTLQTDCTTGNYCDAGGICQPKLTDGAVCAVGLQCLSGNCPAADGVCCDAVCDGICQACLATKTGGTDGTCGPVTSGQDPDTECSGADVCNGAGSCRCADGQVNGAETDVDCGGGVCADCGLGQACSAGTDCVSGNCPTADGVCCNLTCASTCEACLASKTGGTDGACAPVTAGQDPDTECGADVCNGYGACRCTDGQVNGAETGVDCGGGVCPTCADGQGCLSATDCTNGNCPADDQVCCDTACDTLCESCLAAKTGGTNGICDDVTVNTDPDTECGDSESCDGAGLCYDPCPTNTCYSDADCTPGATGDLCVDPADDCLRATCMGGVPGTQVEAGAPVTADFNTWQSSDSETTRGSGRWYCNATLPVTDAGTLTDWELYVDNNGGTNEVAQLIVIRCTAGGGGSGPVLSGCTRVGAGPSQTITGDDLHTLTLAGSTQLDGATPDPTGIVVQAGDIICADSDLYDIGGDCNASSTGGGCPGPDYNTQYLPNLDAVAEPFTLLNSTANGTLMIKAYGSTPATPGTCADDTPEADTTSCTDGGGDTCCSGTCINGPSGPGTCN